MESAAPLTVSLDLVPADEIALKVTADGRTRLLSGYNATHPAVQLERKLPSFQPVLTPRVAMWISDTLSLYQKELSPRSSQDRDTMLADATDELHARLNKYNAALSAAFESRAAEDEEMARQQAMDCKRRAEEEAATRAAACRRKRQRTIEVAAPRRFVSGW